ncbi:hypothetical protein [Thiobacillus sedimenti]|uniref:Lipoprotein n=1 Tax=Thiobacillus sedimenti TaxID=3110231 RepID=A0ABZ1CIW7_9PROT|nr:hypothetical protein [Thiobacillus sp. SCUT-2]WRS39186.1 hypothetical protein VA613_14425 [Thiobacillus sp. SCUT-2]
MQSTLLLSCLVAAFSIAGCDGLTTGEHAQTVPVTENSDGGYGPVTLSLTPEMAPVAINFRAQQADDPAEVGKWNTYHAVLSKDGAPVASGTFNMNNTGTQDRPEGAPYILRNMLTAWPREAGDYGLVITPTKPVEVRLKDTQVVVRRNVRSDVNVR